jgi:hypothetical protein
MRSPFEAAVLFTLATTAFVFWICTVPWAYHDAQKRGRPAALVALLTLLSWPLGLITWLVFRPPVAPRGRSLVVEICE